MAHPNIDERRYFVACLLNRNIDINTNLKKKIASRFSCHVSAIYADLKHFQKYGWHEEFKYGQFQKDWVENDIIEQESWIYTPEQFRKQLIQLPFDHRILNYFDRNPDDIYSLTPRQFEELVAEILKKFGYNVSLGPIGADEGVDIYAERIEDVGPELVLVQCKRYKTTKKIGRPVFQQLNANVYDKKASSGLVVTTSSFTKPAIEYISQSRYRLKGADKERLKEWIRKINNFSM